MKFIINGVDLTNYVRTPTVSIRSLITRQIDTCSLEVVDVDGVAPDVQEKHEIILRDSGDTERYFGGYIAAVDMPSWKQTRRRKVVAQDYSVLLEDVLVNEVYEDKTDKEIIIDLFGTYLAEIDVATYIQESFTIDRIVYNHVTLREALERLSGVSGFDWYVDYYKYLHYFAEETNAAPFELVDTESITTPFRIVSYVKDAQIIENRVLVIGGTYWSPDTDFEIPADNQTTEFLVPYKLHHPVGETAVLVYKNTGTDGVPIWTAQTVGVDYLDTLGGAIDCLYNFQEKLLKFNTAPALLLRAIKITGRYDVPIILRVRSEDSYDEYGRWFDGKIVDKDIDTRDLARQRGKARLAERAFATERGVLLCWTSGLVAGQRLKITNALRSIDSYYLIQAVTTRLPGGTLQEYTVDFGEYNPDLVDMLLDLKRNAEYREARDDELLNECFTLAETLSLADVVTSDATGPKYYVVPAVAPHDEIICGFWKAS